MISLSALADSIWATGQPGTGLNAVLRNVCNRLGGYDPIIGHRTDESARWSPPADGGSGGAAPNRSDGGRRGSGPGAPA
jgi:hypothetical protein